jgi:hypothetical protein
MRVKKKQQVSIIYKKDSSTSVMRATPASVFFRSFFSIDPYQAVRLNVISCNFRIKLQANRKTIKEKFSAATSSAALSSSSREKARALEQSNNVIFEGSVDITKQIPNDMILAILRGDSIGKRRVLKFKDDNLSVFQNTKEVINDNSSLQQSKPAGRMSTQSMRVDLLYRRKKDSASIVNMARFFSPEKSKLSGFKTIDNLLSRAEDKELQFRNSLIKTSSSKSSQTYLEDEPIKFIDVPIFFDLSKQSLANVRVEVDVVSSSGANQSTVSVLQTIAFNVNLAEIYSDFVIPTKEPACQFASYGANRVIVAKQMDPNAYRLKIYRKSMDAGSGATFLKIADLAAKDGDSVRFVDRPKSLSSCIYRVVPFNEFGVYSGQFSSFVQAGLGYNKKYQADTTAIFAYEEGTAVNIKVFNIPDDVISLRLVRKDLTLHETVFTNPNSLKTKSSLNLRREDKTASFADEPTTLDHTFEYRLILTDKSGSERLSQNSCVARFLNDKLSMGQRGINVTDVSTNIAGTQRASFTLSVPPDDATLDKIYAIIEQSGLSTQYVEELKNNRELLSGITAFEITRFDTTSGLNEYFGVFPAGTFIDDESSRKSNGVSPIQPGRTYYYHVRLLVRNASSVFSETSVTQTDQQTGKQYQTNMKKFTSSKVSRRGSLDSTSKQQRFGAKTGSSTPAYASSDDEMIQGPTSITAIVTVKSQGSNIQVNDFKAKAGVNGNILKWQLKAGIQPLDHIILYADYNGRMAPVKALQYCETNSMSYVDNEIDAPLDSVKYYISAVFSDFSESELFGPARMV